MKKLKVLEKVLAFNNLNMGRYFNGQSTSLSWLFGQKFMEMDTIDLSNKQKNRIDQPNTAVNKVTASSLLSENRERNDKTRQ
jgi:hypothetical protein